MALDEHTRVIAELLDDPTLAQQPTLRSAIVRLAELASVAEGKANAVQSLLAQQDRDTRTLRAALEALQSERRAQLASSIRLVASGTPDALHGPVEACAANEPGEAGFNAVADFRVIDGARALLSLAQSSLDGVNAALLLAEWRTFFFDPARSQDGAPLDALCEQWSRLRSAHGCEDAALWCAVIDLQRSELVARCVGACNGALVVGRSVLPLADCELALAPQQALFALNRSAAERLCVSGPCKSRAGVEALSALSVAQLPATLRESPSTQPFAALALAITRPVPAAPSASLPLPELGDEEAELAWVESIGRSGAASPEAVRGLASRYTRLARRLVKIEKISDSYQRELRTTNLALEEANADLAEFSGRVAHDLKSPLAAIIGFASMLGEEPFCSDAQLVGSTVKDIVWSSEKMVEIIDALLLLAKARRGAVPMEPVRVASVFEQALKRVEVLAAERGASVRTDGRECVALGHAAWIEAAVVNLVSNAVRYGGAPPSVSITASEEGPRVVISVSDNGRGLSEADRARLFQPFVRLSKDAGGHGLGLMIVRRVVERMNGSVHVSSVVGQGSVFSISLPRPSAEATVLP